MPILKETAAQFNQVSRLLEISVVFGGHLEANNNEEAVLLFKFPNYGAVENFYSIICKDPVSNITTLMGESFRSPAYVYVVL